MMLGYWYFPSFAQWIAQRVQPMLKGPRDEFPDLDSTWAVETL
jgi:hypothetical protein